MSELLLYHHLGLGDHIICNGLVREYAKRFNRIYLFCKPNNVESVRDMYSDLNLELLIGGDDFARDYILHVKKDYVCVGFSGLNEQESFDYQFYRLVNLSFKTRWESFYCPPNSKEDELFESLNLPQKYALVHEDAERGYLIDHSEISLPIVELEKIPNYSLINWRKVIQGAAEIHTIDSSAMFLADSLEENDAALFVHRYARSNPQWQLPILKRPWKIL
jgi:hypothetical protein